MATFTDNVKIQQSNNSVISYKKYPVVFMFEYSHNDTNKLSNFYQS